jgi:hypothetical protein
MDYWSYIDSWAFGYERTPDHSSGRMLGNISIVMKTDNIYDWYNAMLNIKIHICTDQDEGTTNHNTNWGYHSLINNRYLVPKVTSEESN